MVLGYRVKTNAWFGWGDKSLSEKTIEFWQPETREDFHIPVRPNETHDYYHEIRGSGLRPFERLIPTYNNKGTLFASWNPNRSTNDLRPTVIIPHGGPGINPTEMNAGRWFKQQLGANVLILDSFWSRGIQENDFATNRYGVDMRVLDVVAALRFLTQQPEVDKQFIYIYGGSQGGWLGLRVMTDDPFIMKEINGQIRAAFSLYPWCRESPKYGGRSRLHLGVDLNIEPWFAPRLGPFSGKVYVWTAGRDEATDIRYCRESIFKAATEWNHYPEATHGWDLPNRGTYSVAVDGECARANNKINKYLMCRDTKLTNEILGRIKDIIIGDMN